MDLYQVKKILLMLNTLQSAKLPVSLEKVAENLKQKLHNTLANLILPYVNDNAITYHPAMGMISVEHVMNDSPVELFESVIKPKATVKIKLYHAGLDTVTNRPVQGECYASYEMSESQFNHMLITPNHASGAPITLRQINNEVVTYDRNCDVLTQAISFAEQGYARANTDRLTKMSEAFDLLEEVLNLEKINKASIQPVMSKVALATQHFGNNGAYYLKAYGEKLHENGNKLQAEVACAVNTQLIETKIRESLLSLGMNKEII